MTLAIIPSLLTRVASETYAIPLRSVVETLRVAPSVAERALHDGVIDVRDRSIPVLRLADHFALKRTGGEGKNVFVVVAVLSEHRLGLIVDALLGQQEIIVKPIGKRCGNIPGIAGAAELASRELILVLDVGSLLEEVSHAPQQGALALEAQTPP